MTDAELAEVEIRQRVAMLVVEEHGPGFKTVREVLAVIPKMAARIKELQTQNAHLQIALGHSEARA